MLNEPKIGAIVFSVKDLKRSEAFYGKTLGLQTRLIRGHETHGEEEQPFMIADVGGVSLIFFQRDAGKPGKTPVIVFSLKEGGIEDIVEALAGQGVQIVTPVSEAPGGWTADFLDPDEHVLSFYQSEKLPRNR
jgi:predicted enzyme related to lactoylglutathione lyase